MRAEILYEFCNIYSGGESKYVAKQRAIVVKVNWQVYSLSPPCSKMILDQQR